MAGTVSQGSCATVQALSPTVSASRAHESRRLLRAALQARKHACSCRRKDARDVPPAEARAAAVTPTTTCGHAWSDDGHLDDGAPTYRCDRCGVRSHWPAAEWRCALYPEHAPPLMLTCAALHADQWQPPYMPSPPLRCTVCARRYYAPLHATSTTVCSSSCAKARKLERERIRRGQVSA